jgi:ankyrin repeat protein
LPPPASAADSNAIVQAARSRDGRTVQALIKQRVNVNVREADGTTALHWAVRSGDAAVVDALIGAGADVSARNRYGVTPLSLAAEAGSPALVERLLKAGADAKTLVTEGQTVLMVAARTGNSDAIRRLVAYGADVNAKESWMGETALMWAAAANNGSAVRTLAELGAALDARSATVEYPQQKPAEPSNYVGSFVPKGQWTPLMYAARENGIDAARALVEVGADVNAQDPEGVTPLMQAILNLHYDLAKMLVEKGADPKIADKAGMTPVFAVVEMRTPTWERSRPRLEERDEVDGPTLVGILIDHGANPNAALTGRQLSRYHGAGSAAFAAGTTPLMQAGALQAPRPGKAPGRSRRRRQTEAARWDDGADDCRRREVRHYAGGRPRQHGLGRRHARDRQDAGGARGRGERRQRARRDTPLRRCVPGQRASHSVTSLTRVPTSTPRPRPAEASSTACSTPASLTTGAGRGLVASRDLQPSNCPKADARGWRRSVIADDRAAHGSTGRRRPHRPGSRSAGTAPGACGGAEVVRPMIHRLRGRHVAFALAIASACSAAFTVSAAPAALQQKTVADGVYTREQAERGKKTYVTFCESCHAADLSGNQFRRQRRAAASP